MSNTKYTEERVRKIAKSKGGDLISIIVNDKIRTAELICAKGHKWFIRPDKVDKNWCPMCKGHSIEEMQQLAKKKNGECLSEKYLGIFVNLQWKCEFGHIFETRPKYIIDNHWCPKCNSPHKPTQAEVDDFLMIRKYKCVSPYKNSTSIMKFICDKGHTWSTNFNNLKSKNSGCPKCINKTEQYCRNIFEALFKCSFPSIKPKWLKNADGNLLELDGYNKNLRLAFEYNGIQHYEVVDRWGKTDAALIKQQEHDIIKINKCNERDIILIIIPYTLKTKKDIREFIYEELFDKTLESYSDDNLPIELCI